MQVTVPSEFETFVEAKVRSGEYSDVSEVLQAALGALRDQERADSAEFESLREAIASGIRQLDACEGEPLDMDEIKRTARAIRDTGRD